jgi:hypothetical protein
VTSNEPHEITEQLLDWGNGDQSAVLETDPARYKELRDKELRRLHSLIKLEARGDQ